MASVALQPSAYRIICPQDGLQIPTRIQEYGAAEARWIPEFVFADTLITGDCPKCGTTVVAFEANRPIPESLRSKARAEIG